MAEPVRKLSVPAVQPNPQGFPLLKSLSEHPLPFVQPRFFTAICRQSFHCLTSASFPPPKLWVFTCEKSLILILSALLVRGSLPDEKAMAVFIQPGFSDL